MSPPGRTSAARAEKILWVVFVGVSRARQVAKATLDNPQKTVTFCIVHLSRNTKTSVSPPFITLRGNYTKQYSFCVITTQTKIMPCGVVINRCGVFPIFCFICNRMHRPSQNARFVYFPCADAVNGYYLTIQTIAVIIYLGCKRVCLRVLSFLPRGFATDVALFTTGYIFFTENSRQ